METETIRVHAPSTVVFVCGGQHEPGLERPANLRDAFLRIHSKSDASYKVMLAESSNPFELDAGYKDLFQFESDIAQVVGLILLFVESAGSFAELGAFAALETVAPNLLAVMDDVYYGDTSFIRNGPIRFLENQHGAESVLVLDRNEVGISNTGTFEDLNLVTLTSAVLEPVASRLSRNPKWQKLDPLNSGHRILTVVGLCQEFGALTIGEIRNQLGILGLAADRLSNHLFCAEIFTWIVKIRKGNNIYYAATGGEIALDYSFKSEARTKNHLRWRSQIRDYWKEHDRSRHNAIQDGVARWNAPK